MTLKEQPENVNTLPLPGQNAIDHSARVKQCLLNKIAVKGQISFTEYMQTVLYEAGLGYYSAGSTKLGQQGDFMTAPEISALFSQSLAQAIMPVLQSIKQCEILEVGAGSGRMAVDILLHLETLNSLPERYCILELSADLRERQQAYIKGSVPHLFERVVWFDTLPEGLNAVVVANELLDAMPVVRFKKGLNTIAIECVTAAKGEFKSGYNSDNEFIERSRERVKQIEKECQVLSTNYVSEINFNAEDWLTTLLSKLNSGVVILIDYGYSRCEYYHEQRNNGTLTCFYRHRHHSNPFVYPGLQDVTAHIDFTAIADCGVNNDVTLLGYTTQSNFLMGAGITQLAEQKTMQYIEQDNISKQIELTGQIKKLTMPYEMGEIVKVMGFSKNCEVPIDAFYFNDMRDHL